MTMAIFADSSSARSMSTIHAIASSSNGSSTDSCKGRMLTSSPMLPATSTTPLLSSLAPAAAMPCSTARGGRVSARRFWLYAAARSSRTKQNSDTVCLARRRSRPAQPAQLSSVAAAMRGSSTVLSVSRH